MLTEQATHRLFLRALTRNIWTALVIAATLATLLLVPRQWYWLVPAGLAACCMVAAYRAIGMIRQESIASDEQLRTGQRAEVDRVVAEHRQEVAGLRAQIEVRDKEIARLKVRPYDETKRRHVAQKLHELSIPAKDLLRFLLIRGEVHGGAITEACKFRRESCNEVMDQVVRIGFVKKRDDATFMPAYITTYWSVHPEFVEVLKDLLFPRPDSEGPQEFLY